jgi:wyosine [tRNA(Phe)-imidazoG37] synthetase (radical SAM superfamily)
MLATWHFHIEISSKCTLRCPRCARQEVPDSLINTELNLEFFKRNFTPEFVQANVEKITFCGDDGDPIYAHDLIPVIRYIKSIKPVEIVIVTNGSHKKPDWWQELGSVLTAQDTVHFSIDGWDNKSNNLYRVNSDFNSILEGVTSLRSTSACRTIWAAIAFRFNEDHITKIVALAQSYEFDAVQITKSTKFGSVYPSYGKHDTLEPDKKFVSSSHRFERDVIVLSSRGLNNQTNATNIRLYQSVVESNGVKPLCEIGNKGLYIDARGRLFPCCWVANRYTHNTEWQLLAEQFDLHNRVLAEVVTDDFWYTKFKAFQWQECQSKCSSARINEKYATEW